MNIRYATIFLKLFTLIFVMVAAVFWAGSGMNFKRKYKDEETLVGGAIWSQIIVPIGLMISFIIKEKMDVIVHGYFLLTGVSLLFSAGVVLLLGEFKTLRKQRIPPPPSTDDEGESRRSRSRRRRQHDRVYLVIAVLCLLAGCCMLTEFLMLILL
ncbi:uncharacterized protein LOC106129117 [Amyelois transitella]|uniref:uncharacterized protein LOC106129117 n=1 Tax=Amyelois transitella TaxID=680683 RepID=UPI0029905424|nr:uncharacterized protein LOC106129117 [Amyelois transitella]